MTEHDDEQERAMVQAVLDREGWTKDIEWDQDPDDGNRVRAIVGKFRVIEEDEDEGMYEGDTGKVTVSCVGAAEYRNLRAAIHFWNDSHGGDSSAEVRSVDMLESAD